MTLVYQSTRDANNTVTASQAILQGLATDGGLFTPVSYPKVDLDFETLKDASYQEVAKLVLSAFLDDFTAEELDYCITNAYDSKFDTPAIAPLVKLNGVNKPPSVAKPCKIAWLAVTVFFASRVD